MKIKNYLPKEYTTFKISFLSASIHLTFDDLVINVTCSGVPHEFGEGFFFFFFLSQGGNNRHEESEED
jgi:hypothetical protein